MSAFLKIDCCRTCQHRLPWEWIPAVMINGRALPGTAVWRSQLLDGNCSACSEADRQRVSDLAGNRRSREHLVRLLGGNKPCRDFTFERFCVNDLNRKAFDAATRFNPAIDNVYLWGACGVGKTHLACAMAQRCYDESLRVSFVSAPSLTRKCRMKDPDQEQATIDELVTAELLVLDDLGSGPNTLYMRQLTQEILDGRSFADRSGLVVASRYSLDQLASCWGDDAIPSRLAGLCNIARVGGSDGRLPRPPS